MHPCLWRPGSIYPCPQRPAPMVRLCTFITASHVYFHPKLTYVLAYYLPSRASPSLAMRNALTYVCVKHQRRGMPLVASGSARLNARCIHPCWYLWARVVGAALPDPGRTRIDRQCNRPGYRARRRALLVTYVWISIYLTRRMFGYISAHRRSEGWVAPSPVPHL